MAEEQGNAAISNEEVEALLQNGEADPNAVKPFDFAAQRISRTQLPMLETVNGVFAHRITFSLSGLLGRDVAISFEALEVVTSADRQAALPMPAALAVVRLKPLNGLAYFNIEPELLLTLLDGFFGGSGRPNTDPQTVGSPAALRFLKLMVRSLAADLATAWQPVSTVELELVKEETNPRLLQFGAPTDTVTVSRFAVEFMARSGYIDWLIPDAMLEPVRDALAGVTPSVPVKKQEPWGPQLRSALHDAKVDIRAVLAEAQISLRELVGLSPGDIIPIDAPQQVTMMVGEVPLFQGRFGVSQGRNALKIISG